LRRPLVKLPNLDRFLETVAARPGKEKARRGTNVPPRMAVLFGSEKTGLSNRYLDRCHAVLTVPTTGKCPSMNLSQAVAVCCYEFSRGRKELGPSASSGDLGRHRDALPTVEETRRLVEHVRRAFEAADFLSFLPPREQEKKIWRTFLQWKLRRADLALLHGFLRFILKKVSGLSHGK
ncbi:MAG TPA: TrmH family RNA methyltransferase, partial [Elusimicrobiota bacterium]|nr:TrmH family RNA methyltransferase [Elusimicrobiota bacterium]